MSLLHAAAPERTPDHTPLTVLDVTKWFGETSGGVRTYLLEKQRYVERQAHLRHALVIPGERDSIHEGIRTRIYSLRGPHIPTRKPYRFLLATRSFPRIVQQEHPHVIEVGSPFMVPWLAQRAARPLGIPLVNFFHSNFPKLLGGTPTAPSSRTSTIALQPRHRQLAESLAWHYLRKLDRLFFTTIVASNFSAQVLHRAGIERTIRVPLGVDLDHFHPRRKAYATETRLRFGLPATPLALYVGRFAGEKDLDVIITAWHTIGRKTGMTLVLLGDGPAHTVLRTKARGARIMFLPYQRDREQLADLYGAADLYVAPGPLETFGLSAIEAMASGLPILSVDVGAVSELVIRSGGGMVYPLRDPHAMITVASTLLQQDLRPLGANARAYAEREHTWDIVFEKLFAVYRDAARSGGTL